MTALPIHSPPLPPSSPTLHRLAARYIWWKTPEEAARLPRLVAARVMDIGDWEDVQLLAKEAGEAYLREMLDHAEAGQFSARSWAYWHYRLGLVKPPNPVPPLPERRVE